MNRASKRNSGFSLTEVLIAAGILTVGFMMLLTLFPLGLKLTAKHTSDTIALLASQEVSTNVSELMMSNVEQKNAIPTNAYIDFREVYWDKDDNDDDKDLDDIIDDRESDYVADKGDYELDYDPYLFLYPTSPNVMDEDKKYSSAMLIGKRSGDYAELITFTCRRLGPAARYPAAIDNLNDENNLTNRPNMLSLKVDTGFDHSTVPNNWIKILDTFIDYNAVLDTEPLSSFIATDSRIIINRNYLTYMYGTRVVELKSPAEDGNYYIVVDRGYSVGTRTTFDKIWFVPPAIGAGRSAAVDLTRQTIRIR